MSWASIMNWINVGLNVVNTGANTYAKVKSAENSESNSGGNTTTTTIVRKKSPAEIALEAEKIRKDAERKQKADDFNRAMLLNMSSGNGIRSDDSIVWIAGGLAVVLIVATVVNKSRKKEKAIKKE